MRKLLWGVALVALAFLSAPAASANSIVFTTTLLGSNETPPNASTATGSATVTLDTTALTITVNETFSGLIGGNASAAHIHCCAVPGVATGVAIPFTGFPAATSGTYTHTFDLTLSSSYNAAFITANGGTVALAQAALIAGMLNGLSYVNIHDATFPGGEIRGQLPAVPEPATLTLFGLGLASLGAKLRRRKA